MSFFHENLRDIAARLDLPQPARSRVLIEIAGDLEDLYTHYRQEDLADEEARRLALESLELSDETLAGLARVHGGLLRRLLDRLPSRTITRSERILLTAMVLAAAGYAIGMNRPDTLMAAAGPLVWPVLAAALGSLGITAAKVWQFYLKRDHAIRRLRRGLDTLLVLAGTEVFLGLAGGPIDALRLSLNGADDPSLRLSAMLSWTLQASALLQVALGLALLGALAWFFLAGTVERIERYEAELLLTERGTP